MSERFSHNSKDWAVVVGPESDLDWRATGVEVFDWSERAGQSRSLVEWCRDVPPLLVVDGDDRLVSTVVTAYRRARSPGDPEGRFCAVATDGFDTIASSIDGPPRHSGLPDELAARAEAGEWTDVERPSIRLTDSTEPAPRYGFTFGAGLLVELFEMQYRAGDGGLSSWRRTAGEWARSLISSGGGSPFESESARVTIDYEPWEEEIGFLIAGGLDDTWFGWSFETDGAPKWYGDPSGRAFARGVVRSKTLPAFVRGATGENFDRIHIDWSGGYVLDGELYDPDVPYVLQLAPGPTTTFVR